MTTDNDKKDFLGWITGGIGGAFSKAGDKAKDVLWDVGTGDFMKKYGYAGGLAFLGCFFVKNLSWSKSLMVGGIASAIFGKIIDPLIREHLPKVTSLFNKKSGADENQDIVENNDYKQKLELVPEISGMR